MKLQQFIKDAKKAFFHSYFYMVPVGIYGIIRMFFSGDSIFS